MSVPHYPKVLRLGARYTENVLSGPVVAQEKVDGSQFGFGVTAEGKFCCRSHNVQLDVENPGMFGPAVETARRLLGVKLPDRCDLWFYAEYLAKPKHNTLTYERAPQGNLVLFDMYWPGVRWDNRDALARWADHLGVDLVPQLYAGNASIDLLQDLMATESFLGGETVEGVVVKNYDQIVHMHGMVQPLFCKLVNPAFKERNHKEWKAKRPKGQLDDYMASFRTEARWQKAVQHLTEEGVLTDSPRDIGMLIKAVQQDIVDEELSTIEQELGRMFIKSIGKAAVKGLAEWYKESLLERLEA